MAWIGWSQEPKEETKVLGPNFGTCQRGPFHIFFSTLFTPDCGLVVNVLMFSDVDSPYDVLVLGLKPHVWPGRSSPEHRALCFGFFGVGSLKH